MPDRPKACLIVDTAAVMPTAAILAWAVMAHCSAAPVRAAGGSDEGVAGVVGDAQAVESDYLVDRGAFFFARR